MTEADPKTSSRYPYTFACDAIRAKSESPLSRAQASKIRTFIAEVIGVPDEELAKKIADYYIEHEEEITALSLKAFGERMAERIDKRLDEIS